MVEDFARLKEKGATPCPQCGDVFPTHRLEHCPNYPYVIKGDKGFKAAYDARAMVIAEWLRAVLDRIAPSLGAQHNTTNCGTGLCINRF